MPYIYVIAGNGGLAGSVARELARAAWVKKGESLQTEPGSFAKAERVVILGEGDDLIIEDWPRPSDKKFRPRDLWLYPGLDEPTRAGNTATLEIRVCAPLDGFGVEFGNELSSYRGDAFDLAAALERDGLSGVAQTLWRLTHPETEFPRRSTPVDNAEEIDEAPAAWTSELLEELQAIALLDAALRSLKMGAEASSWLGITESDELQNVVEDLQKVVKGWLKVPTANAPLALRECEKIKALISQSKQTLDEIVRHERIRIIVPPTRETNAPAVVVIQCAVGQAPLARALAFLRLWEEKDWAPTDPVRVLLLESDSVQSGQGSLSRVEYFADRPCIKLLSERLGELDSTRGLNKAAKLTYGGHLVLETGRPGGRYSMLESAVNMILQETLVASRPILAYDCTFFAHLTDVTQESDAAWPLLEQFYEANEDQWHSPDTAAKAYFLNTVTDTLGFNKDALTRLLSPVEQPGKHTRGLRWLTCLASFSVCLPNWEFVITSEAHSGKIHYKIADLKVHFFYNRTIALEWAVGWNDSKDHPTESAQSQNEEHTQGGFGNRWPMCDEEGFSLWRALMTHPGTWRTVADVLDHTKMLRDVYSPFNAEEDEITARWTIELRDSNRKTVPESTLKRGDKLPPKDPAKPQYFLGRIVDHVFGTSKKDSLRLTTDSRLSLVEGIFPAGPHPQSQWAQNRMRNVLEMMRMGDGYTPVSGYSDEFIRRQQSAVVYDRWIDAGSAYAASDRSFVYLGYGKYANTAVRDKHLPSVYRRMALIAQLYSSVLRAFSNDVNRSLERWPFSDTIPPQAYAELQPPLLKFSNVVWHQQLSSQVQGEEMYDLIQRATAIDEQYVALQNELQATNEYRQAEHEIQAENRVRALSSLALPLALLVSAWQLIIWLFSPQSQSPSQAFSALVMGTASNGAFFSTVLASSVATQAVMILLRRAAIVADDDAIAPRDRRKYPLSHTVRIGLAGLTAVGLAGIVLGAAVGSVGPAPAGIPTWVPNGLAAFAAIYLITLIVYWLDRLCSRDS